MIRDILPDEAPALAAIFSASRRAAMPWLRHVHSEAEEAAFITGIALPRARVWVAEVDGRPAGFLAREDAWIAHLYLGPAHWRRGLGGALLAAARHDAPPLLRLYTFQRNLAARAFYEKHGFRAVTLGDGSGNMEAEPDVLYECRATPAQEKHA